MTDQFSEMDNWTSEQVSLFKEQAKYKEQHLIYPLALRTESLKTEADQRKLIALVAEGDSWFDYSPGTDIIDCLRHHYEYVIDNYANAGDTLENMIYGTSINKRYERVNPKINEVLRRIKQLKPKVFLFSGGGNDVAGEEFESYLNHMDSGLTILREQFVNDMINNVFRKYFKDLISKVAAVSPQTQIIVHGYGHTAPTEGRFKFEISYN